jgi:hypothetical protein
MTEPAPPPEEDKHAWARKLADDGTWILHTGTRTVSKVVKFYDGVNDTYISTYNGQPTKGPVIELEDGNTFVAKAEFEFVPMEEEEVKFFQFVQMKVGEVTRACAELGATKKMTMAKTMLLVGTALRQTARATDLAVAKPKGQKPDVRP